MSKIQKNQHPITLEIIATSTYALPLIQKISSIQVHSVYSHSVNLLINHHLLTIQTKGSALSPLSLICSLNAQQLSQLPWKRGEYISARLIIAHDCTFYDTALIPHTMHKVRSGFYRNFAAEVIRLSQPQGFGRLLENIETDDLILNHVQKVLHNVEVAFKQGLYQQAALLLSGLIGVGIGLTPSGDDFLCGVLAMLSAAAMQHTPLYRSLLQEIDIRIAQTNEISAAFLRCAMQNQYAQAVIDFFDINQLTDMKQVSVLQSFQNIGHSSGMDTLFGIYFAAAFLM